MCVSSPVVMNNDMNSSYERAGHSTDVTSSTLSGFHLAKTAAHSLLEILGAKKICTDSSLEKRVHCHKVSVSLLNK